MRAALLVLAGCIPPPGTSVHDPDVDDDGDGWTEHDGDCDDTDPTVGLPSSWYLDADGDGYGVPDDPVEECSAPGRVLTSDDCDDTDPDTFPGVDNDEDGFLACTECDDGDGDVFPGAADPCAGPDMDCDPSRCEVRDPTVADAAFALPAGPDEGGQVTVAGSVVGVGASTRTPRDDLDAGSRAWLVVGPAPFTTVELGFEDQGLHTRVLPVGDVTGADGIADWVVSSHCWTPETVEPYNPCFDPGYAVLLDGSALSDGPVGSEGQLVGTSGDCVGMAAAAVDDGFAISGGCANADDGVVWFVAGSLVDLSGPTPLSAAVRMEGAAELSAPGWTLAAGDLDGDGLDDLAVGNYGYFGMEVVVVHDASIAPAAPLVDGVRLGSGVPGSYGTSGTQLAFLATEAGTDRLVVGISGDTEDLRGRVYLDAPRVDGDLANSDVTLEGPLSLGGAVGPVGDVDGDGVDDLAVGAPDDDAIYVNQSTAGGTAYVVSGASIGSSGIYDIDSVALLRVVGEESAHLGVSVGGGDLDGDGFGDLVVGQEDPRDGRPSALIFLNLTSDATP